MPYQIMFSVDLNRCINCKTCEMACNGYYDLNAEYRRHVVTYRNKSNIPIHISISCNHCANPVCVSICPENNFQKRRDGIVVHSANHCQACLRCISACPFHAPKLNPKTKRADKCNFCVERLDQGLKPICVENCVTGALSIMEINRDDAKSYSINKSDVPIATYTSPSIFVINKQNGYRFFREG